MVQRPFEFTKWVLLVKLNRLRHFQLTLLSEISIQLRWCLDLFLVIDIFNWADDSDLFVKTSFQLLDHFDSRWHYLYCVILELLYKGFQYWLLVFDVLESMVNSDLFDGIDYISIEISS